MITVCDKPLTFDPDTPLEYLISDPNKTMKDKIRLAIEMIKTLPIDGCITGSCLMENFDPDEWGCKPDIDVFVFSETELVNAINLAQYVLKMEPGVGTPRSKQQEEWKLQRLRQFGLNYKIGITTYKFYCCGVMLNITFKQRKIKNHWVPLTSTSQVLESFDMSIVMQGYDIKHHVHYDMRIGDPMVAVPNPLRDNDCMIWTVAKWIRQFDRVVKYYNRGFDTRPMARFYLDLIDDCINAGCLFDSEESKEMFTKFSQEFIDKRNDIEAWLEAHKED